MATTIASRIGELYRGGKTETPASMAWTLEKLARIGIAACDSNANVDTEYPLATLFEVMGAIAAELEDALETQEEAARKACNTETPGPAGPRANVRPDQTDAAA